jgi:hypothetical protein
MNNEKDRCTSQKECMIPVVEPRASRCAITDDQTSHNGRIGQNDRRKIISQVTTPWELGRLVVDSSRYNFVIASNPSSLLER